MPEVIIQILLMAEMQWDSSMRQEHLFLWMIITDDYPNIKAYYTDEEWNKLRRDDGHIYWIQQFQNVKGEEKATTHNDEAFWIQTKYWSGQDILK